MQRFPSKLDIRKPEKFAYSYTANFGVIVKSTSKTNSIQIKMDTDFVWYKAVASCYISDSSPSLIQDSVQGLHYAGLYLLITENLTEAKLSNIATPLMCSFGTSQQPFILPQPKILLGNSVLSLQVSNRYTGEDIFVDLTFIGVSIPVTAASRAA